MYTIDFQKPIHVHFIGIGGISMSGLAEILLNRHFTVTGSDMQASDMTKHLEETGAKVLTIQSMHNVSAEEFNNGETYVSIMRKNAKAVKEAFQ